MSLAGCPTQYSHSFRVIRLVLVFWEHSYVADLDGLGLLPRALRSLHFHRNLNEAQGTREHDLCRYS